ncbi:response regulator [Pedosphaera parvula]|uniref:Response regulator receiver protein n=1 Tax=Pedosphaera parvula (strain Ellin514) TaxID=320771 RepID=B9XES6_PEDPL|nr:response regulator [Pedosphaera parvula]EEF61790.1 response regulator receiver protein [Pedosphaera parvula Ellin514]
MTTEPTFPANPIILLVEDMDNDVRLMQIACKKAGYQNELQRAKNGVEAIAYLKGEGLYGNRDRFPFPTAMLLDLNMPQKDGFEVLTWLKQQPRLKRFPIFVLTASSQERDIELALDLGANGYLVKPSTITELIEMAECLHRWLGFNQFAALP